MYGTFPTEVDPKSPVIWEAFQPQTEPRRAYRRSKVPGLPGQEPEGQEQNDRARTQAQTRPRVVTAPAVPQQASQQPAPSAALQNQGAIY